MLRVFWLDKDGLGVYKPACKERLFKWVLFEREGRPMLMAMSYDAGYVFHMEAVAQAAIRSGWCDEKGAEKFLKRSGNVFHEAGIRVLGGGVRFESGKTRNFSYRFGPVPERFEEAVSRALGL
jgi:hypothetical protein